MPKTTNSRPGTLEMLAVYVPIPFIANALTILSLNFLQNLILPTSVNALLAGTPDWARLTAQIAPHPIVSSMILAYVWPVLRVTFASNAQEPISERVRARLLNFPLTISLLGMSGWLVAYVFLFFAYYIRIPVFPTREVVGAFLFFLFISTPTFVGSYYLMELANRRYSIPRFLPDGNLSRINGVINVSLQGRFFIYLYAVSGFVLLAFYFILLRLNNDGRNALGRDLVWEATLLLLILGTFAVVLTWVLARAYQKPLREMRAATRRIRSGDYQVDVRVVTTDEIGYLGEGLNQMAAELREKDLIKDTFGRMVDPAVRDHLLSGNLDLGGELKHVSILFSDIRDFTAMSEKMEPRRIVELLNRYFERMGACIAREGGLVNKFIGDSIMAIFGAPLELQNHAAGAVRAARAMREDSLRLNREFEADGLPQLRTGVGIHSGMVLAGNIGGSERMEYTVIGDSVNQASRIEGLCKKLGHDLIVSQATADLLTDEFAPESMGRVKVKGKEEAIQVYRL